MSALSTNTELQSEAQSATELRLIRKSQPIPPERFLSIVWILITKPHVVDGRLTGADILECREEPSQKIVTVTASVPELSPGNILKVRRKLAPKNPQRFSGVHEECRIQPSELFISTEGCRNGQNAPEPLSCAPFVSVLRLDDDNCVSLWTSSDPCARLTEKLFTSLERWARRGRQDIKQMQVPSLGVVRVERYSRIYADLKLKYGRKLVEIWPEKTDPLKFVYEDIAIASYLIALWDPDDDGHKPSFVDVGCGNGLLVYILVLEGHSGLGVDVRKRNIWSLYPPEVRECLREEAVTPENRFEAEWWIGNHSDELTPWIPLLAAMTSPSANVFLLPCCPYGLYGKYQRDKPNLSQYQSYLAYLKDDFLPECSFKVRVDKLRIPSTKRICFILSEREDEPRDKVIARLRHRLEEEQKMKFVPRAKEILVRNCTQVDRNITDRIVHRVALRLLSLSDKNASNGFNVGGQLSLAEAVALTDETERALLKSQCGGLQTLLRNNYHIFHVRGGTVKLRIPTESTQDDVSDAVQRRRPCWFDSNHPQGCPVDRMKCRFAHQT